LVAVLLPLTIRRRALILLVIALTATLGVAAVQAVNQMHDIGHHRDQHTPLVGVKDFTPPFLGTTKIAQFEVSSRFGLGAWLIGVALTLQLGAACLSRCRDRNPALKRSAASLVRESQDNSKICGDKAVHAPTS
jgi:hypothetical protein